MLFGIVVGLNMSYSSNWHVHLLWCFAYRIGSYERGSCMPCKTTCIGGTKNNQQPSTSRIYIPIWGTDPRPSLLLMLHLEMSIMEIV